MFTDDCTPIHKDASYCYLISCEFIVSTSEDNLAPLQIEKNVLRSLDENIKDHDSSIPGLLFIQFDKFEQATNLHNFNRQPILFLLIFVSSLIIFLTMFRRQKGQTNNPIEESKGKHNNARNNHPESGNFLLNETGVMT